MKCTENFSDINSLHLPKLFGKTNAFWEIACYKEFRWISLHVKCKLFTNEPRNQSRVILLEIGQVALEQGFLPNFLRFILLTPIPPQLLTHLSQRSEVRQIQALNLGTLLPTKHLAAYRERNLDFIRII
jgi:hypothetical protein